MDNRKNGGSIRRVKREAGPVADSNSSLGWHTKDWLVPFRGGYALVHHSHGGHFGSDENDGHALCGPVIFCCHRSRQQFLSAYPHSELACADWSRVPAEQIISWLEAGVQVIYFIYCAPEVPAGLAASGLSGRQARQTLQRQTAYGDSMSGSSQMLVQIVRGGDQISDESGGDALPMLSLS